MRAAGGGAADDRARPDGLAPDGGFELGAAPRDDPLIYPGAVPPFSFLFTGDAVEPIEEDDSSMGRADERLAERGAVGMDRRHVVVAYGSNRSPAQLRAKFAGAGISPILPVLRARVDGLAVVYACHVARYGSVPATVVAMPGIETEVAVTFLDDDQCDLIDATEPVHERPVLDGDRHPLRLVGGRGIASYRCYRSTRDVLTIGGLPISLAEVPSTGGDLPSRTQREVQLLLLGLWNRRLGAGLSDPPAFVEVIRADPELRADVDRCLAGLSLDPDPAVGATAPIRFGHTGDGEPPPAPLAPT